MGAPFVQQQINQMQWTLVSDPEKPPEFERVLATVEGYKKPCLCARWNNEWFLISDFEQKFEGTEGKLKVLAWRYFPEIYKPQ